MSARTQFYLATVLLVFFGAAQTASASTLTTLGVVDFIDAIFQAGGGSYTKSLTGGPDDGWSVFAANSGDTITVTFSATTGTSNAFAAYDGAVLLDLNGVVAVGDPVNVTNFSIDRTGLGTALTVQHSGFNGTGYQFDSTTSQTFSVPLGITGQYAIGVSCSNEICVNGSTFTVRLSGNTGSVPVPSPATLPIFALGLAALVFARRRMAA